MSRAYLERKYGCPVDAAGKPVRCVYCQYQVKEDLEKLEVELGQGRTVVRGYVYKCKDGQACVNRRLRVG